MMYTSFYNDGGGTKKLEDHKTFVGAVACCVFHAQSVIGFKEILHVETDYVKQEYDMAANIGHAEIRLYWVNKNEDQPAPSKGN